MWSGAFTRNAGASIFAALVGCRSSLETAPTVLETEPPASIPAPTSNPAREISCRNGDGLQQGAPWPMDGACPTRSHRSTTSGPAVGHVRWTARVPGLGSAIENPPIVAADGTILVTTDHVLTAFAPDGAVQWSFAVDDGDWIAAAPAIGRSETIYLPGYAKVYAIDFDAKVRWTYAYPTNNGQTGVYGSAAIGTDETIYVPALSALVALNPNGTVRWTVPFPNQLLTSPVIDESGVVYAIADVLYAFDPITGQSRWTFSQGGDGSPFASTLIQAPDGRLYVSAQAGNLWALDGNGAVVRHEIITDLSSWLVADMESNLRLGRTLSPARVESRDSSNTTLWSTALPSKAPQQASAIVLDRDGTVYLLGEHIVAISASGLVRWSLEVPSAPTYPTVRGGAALGASVLYVAQDGDLIAIGAEM